MAKRWLSFVAVWLCCLIFFYAYRQWASMLLFGSITMLPAVALFLSRKAIRSTKLRLDLPAAVNRGDAVTLQIGISCDGPHSDWRVRATMRHSVTGQKKKLRPGTPLPTGHCGTWEITIHGLYVFDILGLFPFRASQPQTFHIPVRPLPIAPDALPELGNHTAVRWQPRRGGGFSENHDLRLYRPGDNLQQIHWKLSAKTGNLILREPLEPLRNRLLLRLDYSGTPAQINYKLGVLLWMSRYLLSKKLPHHWQVMTGAGIRTFYCEDEYSLLKSLDALLQCKIAADGTVLDTQANAAWWHYIGGDASETA
jgi:hypothetical protein